MNLVTAIQVLFAQNAPAGANFEEAFIALEGKKLASLSRADVATLDELADTFQDFVHDPAGWPRSGLHGRSTPFMVGETRPGARCLSQHTWWIISAYGLNRSSGHTT